MKNVTKLPLALFSLVCFTLLFACRQDPPTPEDHDTGWKRIDANPIHQDLIPTENYEVASDGHVFFDEHGKLHMIYSGDTDGHASIKLATGNSLSEWEIDKPLLFETGPSNLDTNKETSFYRRAKNGKHQIYYIGYRDDEDYQAQIFLAEADSLEGPYVQSEKPLIPRGEIAGRSVYCITSPSVIEHEGLLYIVFLGWNASPSNVTAVWVIGATSSDDGYT